jgi:hypothetical protein
MKPQLFVIFFLALFIVTGSCRKNKDEDISVRGTVFDPNLNVYVNDAYVTISSIKVQSGIYNSNYQDIETVVTDYNGKFAFDIKKELASSYRIYIRKDNYFSYTVDISPDVLESGIVYSPTYNLFPEAYIKLHVKNTMPYDSTDFIAYSFTNSNLNCYECCTNNVFKGYGEDYDYTLKCKTNGSQYIKMNWHVTKNGTDISYKDSVFCIAFDTIFYQIYY